MIFRFDIGGDIHGIPKVSSTINVERRRSALRKQKDGTQMICGGEIN